MKLKLIYIFCIVVVFVLGCAKPPVEEMQRAREAVFKAENDPNAVQYASGTLARARDAIKRMETEADSKNYENAKTSAAEAIAAAEKAINDGKVGAQRAGEEANSLISGLRTEIDETTKNVAAARYSQLVLDYDAIDRAIVDAHNLTDQAEVDQAAGRNQEALDKAKTVRSSLNDINQKVAGATTGRKK
jgi:flagellar biosynthesis/type III secretory pathway protein FliH